MLIPRQLTSDPRKGRWHPSAVCGPSADRQRCTRKNLNRPGVAGRTHRRDRSEGASAHSLGVGGFDLRPPACWNRGVGSIERRNPVIDLPDLLAAGHDGDDLIKSGDS